MGSSQTENLQRRPQHWGTKPNSGQDLTVPAARRGVLKRAGNAGRRCVFSELWSEVLGMKHAQKVSEDLAQESFQMDHYS